MNLSNKSKHRIEEVRILKMKTARKVLCANLPPCFLEAFNYIDSFKGIGHIDYAYLRKLFQDNCINLPNIRVNLELEPPSLKRTLSQQ